MQFTFSPEEDAAPIGVCIRCFGKATPPLSATRGTGNKRKMSPAPGMYCDLCRESLNIAFGKKREAEAILIEPIEPINVAGAVLAGE